MWMHYLRKLETTTVLTRVARKLFHLQIKLLNTFSTLFTNTSPKLVTNYILKHFVEGFLDTWVCLFGESFYQRKPKSNIKGYFSGEMLRTATSHLSGHFSAHSVPQDHRMDPRICLAWLEVDGLSQFTTQTRIRTSVRKDFKGYLTQFKSF